MPLNVEEVKGNISFLYTLLSLRNMFRYISLAGFFSEMLDGCRALLSMATVTTSHVFDQLLKSSRSVFWS